MGKVKKLRQKFNTQSKIDTNQEIKKSTEPNKNDGFPGTNFNFAKIEETNSNFIKKTNDKTPMLDKIASGIKKTISKKDKMKTRRSGLLMKIGEVTAQKIEEKRKEKAQKTVIVGDLKALKDALPSLDELFLLKPKPDAIKTGMKPDQRRKIVNKLKPSGLAVGTKVNKKTKKELKKQRIKKLAKEYKQRFNAVQKTLKHDEFKNNPREAIATHIKLTMLDGK